MSQMKVVSLIGTVLVIPWEGILALFWSLGGDTSPSARLFLCLGILLNGAALEIWNHNGRTKYAIRFRVNFITAINLSFRETHTVILTCRKTVR
jgi:hypothetical protein